MKPLRGRALWEKIIADQRKWIEECGGTLAGYVRRYHETYGRTIENAIDIYNADVAYLRKMEQRLAGCR